MVEYYISSTQYTVQERQTKRSGTVYDVVFRIVTMDGEEKQKKLSGFKTKTAAKQGYTEFVTTTCTLVRNNPIKTCCQSIFFSSGIRIKTAPSMTKRRCTSSTFCRSSEKTISQT